MRKLQMPPTEVGGICTDFLCEDKLLIRNSKSKSPRLSSEAFDLELLGGFEPPTSSLPTK